MPANLLGYTYGLEAGEEYFQLLGQENLDLTLGGLRRGFESVES
jgi:hypothetical protein